MILQAYSALTTVFLPYMSLVETGITESVDFTIQVELATGHYILHDFHRSDLLTECSQKHQNLLVVRRHFEDLLHISSHIWAERQK